MQILLAAALFPAIALMFYVYNKDKIEPEPTGLVLKVFALGAGSGLVAGFIEAILISVFESVLPAGVVLLVVEYFIGVVLVEELCKFFCLNTVKKRPEFNYVFDAIVYSVAAALGFAALENVFYVLDGGLETAALRAVLSVPGHMADGVVMGVFFGIARRHELHGRASQARTNYILAVLLPVLEHGLYDGALSTDSDIMALFAIVFDLAFIILAFVLIRHTSSRDEPLHPSLVAPQPAPNQVMRAMPPYPGAPQQPGMPQYPGAAQQPGAAQYPQQQYGQYPQQQHAQYPQQQHTQQPGAYQQNGYPQQGGAYQQNGYAQQGTYQQQNTQQQTGYAQSGNVQQGGYPQQSEQISQQQAGTPEQ